MQRARSLCTGNVYLLPNTELDVDDSCSATQSSSGMSTYVETWVNTPSASQSNRPPQRLSLINHNQQNLLKAHQDTITSLICIDSPFRGGIVSGDRAGVIKVWRVESLE